METVCLSSICEALGQSLAWQREEEEGEKGKGRRDQFLKTCNYITMSQNLSTNPLKTFYQTSTTESTKNTQESVCLYKHVWYSPFSAACLIPDSSS